MRAHGPILALIAEGFLSRLSFGIVGFALPLYAANLGVDLAGIGLLASLNVGVSFALRPLTGWIADRAGLKRTFTLGVVLRSAVALLLAVAGAPWQLFGIRATLGVSQSLRDPSVNVLLVEHAGEQSVASAFAWYASAKLLAGALGAALAGVLLTESASNFRLVFIVAFGLSIVPLYVVLHVVQERSPAARINAAGGSAVPPVVASGGSWQAIASFTSLGFLVTGTAQMFKGLLPVLATRYAGLSEAEAGMAYLVPALVVVGSGPLFGWLADNVSHRLVFAVRGLANVASSLVLLAFPTMAGISLGAAVDEVGKSAYRPAWGALMARVARLNRTRRAQAMSIMSMSEDAGEIIGPILTGLVWGAWGVPTALILRVLLAVGTEAYALALFRSLEWGRQSPEPEGGRPPEVLGVSMLAVEPWALSDGAVKKGSSVPPEPGPQE